MRTHSAKIGWLHTLASDKNTKFDLTIKDALGRVKYTQKDCGNESKEFGQLVNLPTIIGEDLTVEVDNIRGGEDVRVFLN